MGFDDLVVLNRRGDTTIDLDNLGELRTDADVIWLGLEDGHRFQRGGTFMLLDETTLDCLTEGEEVAFCKNDLSSR